MVDNSNNFIRNNTNLKAPNVTQYIDQRTFQQRIQQVKRIHQDIEYFAQKYFYIISLDQGKKIIKLYPKQAQLVKKMKQKRRLITLACRQCGKSTSYSIYVLWYCLVNSDKKALICANKLKTAVQILSRIKMAYQMLPNWLKPGIVTWNRTSVQFSNGCKITAEATSESSGRGGSINLLLLDEFAFLSPGIQQGFMASVFPVVSSSKTSQIIIVSTPNGMNNQYYRIWNKARLNINDSDDVSWFPVQIDWWEVPGRDAKWKAQQMATFNNNQQKFNQQYGNSFLGSVATLISGKIIQKFKKLFDQNKNIEPQSIQLHKEFQNTKVNIYYPPQRNRAYVIGADPSTGIDSDYQALTVWDITNPFDIRMACSFYQNDIPPKVFAYIICKLGYIYNNAYVAMQNNGVSFATLDYLYRQFEYQNVIHQGGNIKTSIGISSTGQRKYNACMNFKQILQNKARKIQISDGRLIQQMQRFERHNRSGKTPSYYATSGHDDLMMCSIWAFYVFIDQLLDNYYNVLQYTQDNFGKQVPLLVTSFQDSSVGQSTVMQFIKQLDQKFANNHQPDIDQLQQQISSNKQQIMQQFNKYNTKTTTNNNYQQQSFQFGGFFI